jgi:drug/metabolite transporter (DMT)-like permease
MKKALVQLHIAVWLAGFTGILGALISLNEIWLVWYRIAITVMTLLIWRTIQSTKSLLLPKQRNSLLGIGAIIALHWVFFYGSIKLSTVSVGLVCFASVGFFTSLTEPFFNGGKVSRWEMMLGLISLAGIYIIFHFDTRYRTGIIMGTASSMLAAVFSALNKKMIDTTPRRDMLFYEMTGGLAGVTLLLPIYLHFFPATHALPTSADWGWLFILSWACTILAFECMLSSLRHLSAFTQSLTLNLEPVYGILMAFIFFQENDLLHPSFYVGCSLIIFSVCLQMYRIYRKRQQPPAAS